MTFLSPWWLAGGLAAALALVGLHLLAIGRPAPLLLPTARFVPQRSARARRLARRPTDVLLLAVRVAAVLLAATALARPVRTPTRRAIARVIVADRSRAVADAGAVRDSVRAVAGAGDLLIAFDTIASEPLRLSDDSAARDSAVGGALVSATAMARAPAGSLSAALAAARRAAPRLRESADSVELIVVSPLTTREVDAATAAVRGTWTGRVRPIQVPPATDSATPNGVRVVARGRAPTSDDALSAAASLLGRGGRRQARIVRDGPTAADVAWARDSAGVLLDWPADALPAEWTRRARPDSVGAVVAGMTAFVAPLVRRAEWPATIDGRGATRARQSADVEREAPATQDVQVVARWADGTPAAVERATGTGCTRSVAIPVPQIGDAALRPPFLALLGALTGPCAAHTVGAPLDPSAVRALAGAGPLLATSTLAALPAADDLIARWLLAAALALLALELPLRLVGRPRGAEIDDLDETDAPSAARPREAA